jgi:hypothetical protein
MYGTLSVTVIKAALTHDVCTFSTMDPQFIATLSSTKVYKSSIKMNEGKYPMWNETFTFNVQGETMLTIDILHEKTLVILNITIYLNIYFLGWSN